MGYHPTPRRYRTWDLLTIGAIFMAGFLYYRVSVEWPVVWSRESLSGSAAQQLSSARHSGVV